MNEELHHALLYMDANWSLLNNKDAYIESKVMYMHDFIFQKSPGRYTVYQMIQKKKRVCVTHT